MLVGVPTFLYCVVDASRQHGVEWLLLASLALISSLFPIHIVTSVRDGTTHSLCVNVSDVFVFLGLMLFGPSVAASLATIDGAVTGIRGQFKKPYKYFFNLSLLCVAAWVSGWCFYFLLGVPPPIGTPQQVQDDFGVFFARTNAVVRAKKGKKKWFTGPTKKKRNKDTRGLQASPPRVDSESLWEVSRGLYRGVAPRASLIDVKVLGDDGMGRVSHLIAAIEWVTEYRGELDVRVANFSVSTPAFEPFYQDPLCEAVKHMTRSGITVVASSGNLGRLEGYPEIWESITSPGTSPYVITAYPLNHKGTADRTDDIATTYGSRGPSFGTNLWKPDLAAPGNRITSLLSPESWLAIERSDSRIRDEYLEMSGGSMAVMT